MKSNASRDPDYFAYRDPEYIAYVEQIAAQKLPIFPDDELLVMPDDQKGLKIYLTPSSGKNRMQEVATFSPQDNKLTPSRQTQKLITQIEAKFDTLDQNLGLSGITIPVREDNGLLRIKLFLNNNNNNNNNNTPNTLIRLSPEQDPLYFLTKAGEATFDGKKLIFDSPIF